MGSVTRVLGENEIHLIGRRKRWLDRVLAATFISLIVVLVVTMIAPSGDMPVAAWLALTLTVSVVVFAVGTIWLLVILIDLPPRVGGSSIVWAGLALITSPIGPLIAGALLKTKVDGALETGKLRM